MIKYLFGRGAIPLAFICFLLFSVGAEAQSETPQKIPLAVYVTGVSDGNNIESIKNIAQNKVITILVNTGEYIMIERSKDFLDKIREEQNKQGDGSVSDDQIRSIGQGSGAQQVCVVNVNIMQNDNYAYVAVRMIDMVNTVSENAGDADNASYKGPGDLGGIIQSAVNVMRGESPTSVSAGKPKKQSGSHKNGEVYNPDGIEMVYVEGTGTGILDTKGFYIGKYEVTQAQWKAVMGNNPSNFTGDNLPVENVSWNDCQEFITKLNSRTERTYSLPTEAQWEYAARGGKAKETYEYAGSNTVENVAWYTENSGGTTHQVGTKSPNSLGIYDMSGNVWEWCENCYDSSCSYRVFRGGGWSGYASCCRVADRGYNTPDIRYGGLGFRLALVQ